MDQKEFEKRMKSPEIQEMILSQHVLLTSSIAARLAPTCTTVRPDFIFMAICILPMNLCWSAKADNLLG